MRLIEQTQVERTERELATACEQLVSALRRTLSSRLRQHGMSLADARSGLPAGVWSEGEWARLVDEHLAPVARQVAARTRSELLGRLDPAVVAGMKDQTAAWAALIVNRALQLGPRVGQLVTGRQQALTAAGNIVAIRDALDAAAAELDRLVPRTASHLANAAAIDAAEAITDATGETVRQVWATQGDDRVRPSHDEMDGQQRPEGEPFESGDGNLLMYPGDPDGPDEDVENCRCWLETVGVEDFVNVGPSPAAGGNADAIARAVAEAAGEIE